MLLLFELSFLAAQQVSPFWVEQFSSRENFEAQWATGGQNSGTETWKWSMNPKEATFGNQPVFASQSVSNGYILFNSDANGNQPFQTTVTSPGIDISGKSNLFLKFETQYGFFSKKGLVRAELGYSFNGTDFSYIQVLDFVTKNTLQDSVLLQIVELPLETPQEKIFLQFRWKGQYEYAWKVDDLALYDSNPTPSNDLVVSHPKGASNHTTPLSQVSEVQLAATVTNQGVLPQTNIKVKGSILYNGMETFSTYINLPHLAPDSSVLISFDRSFSPKVVGEYAISYEVIPETIDDMPGNNKILMPFIISEHLLSKDDQKIIGATQPSAPGSDSWEAGNLYYIENPGYSAFKAQISVMSQDGPNGYAGSSVAVFLYEVKESNSGIISDETLEIKGFGSYTFGKEAPFEIVEVDLTDLDTGLPGIRLDEDKNYLITVQYPNHLLVPYCTLPYFYDYATVVKNNRWYPGGFGPEITVVARMVIRESSYSESTPVHQVPEIAGLFSLYPNPAGESTNILYKGDGFAKISWQIRDLQGRIVNKGGIAEPVFGSPLNIHLGALPSGTYIADIKKDGQLTSIPFIKN